MKNKISGIYKIQSKIHPDRIYIGSAVDTQNRWNKHISLLKRGIHHSHKLQRYFNKYPDSLQFCVIFVCLKEDLIKYEQKFMDELSPYFNECRVAGSQLGFKHSKETIEKLKGNKNTLGFKHSEEFKQGVSRAKSIPIIQYDKQGNFIREWDSATKASKELLISRNHVSRCCRGVKYKFVGGFIWKQKQVA